MPSRRDELRRVGELVARSAADKRPVVVAVVGESGSGRTRFMQELTGAAIRARPSTRALCHSRGLDLTDVQGWPSEVARHARRTASVTKVAGGALGLVGAVPAAAAVHHATQGLTAAAAGLDHALARRVPDVADVPDFFDALASLSRRGPAVGVVDDVDGPDADVWLTGVSQYLWDRARRRAVTLVVSAVESDGHSVLTGWCERWRSQGIATVVVTLGKLTAADVAAIAGRCDATALAALDERGRGNLRATRNAWATWRRNGTVRRGLTGTWALSDRKRPSDPDDPVQRLWEALGSARDGNDTGLTARALLDAAALQGSTFLVEAAAAAVHLPTATALDIVEGLAGAEHPLLGELRQWDDAAIDGTLTAASFTDVDLLLVLTPRLGDAHAATLARAQAAELTRRLGPEPREIAPVMCRLARYAGDRVEVLRWQRIADHQLSDVGLDAVVDAYASAPTALVDPQSADQVVDMLVARADDRRHALTYDQRARLLDRAVAIAERLGTRSGLAAAGATRVALAFSERSGNEGLELAERLLTRLGDDTTSVDYLRVSYLYGLKVSRWDPVAGGERLDAVIDALGDREPQLLMQARLARWFLLPPAERIAPLSAAVETITGRTLGFVDVQVSDLLLKSYEDAGLIGDQRVPGLVAWTLRRAHGAEWVVPHCHLHLARHHLARDERTDAVRTLREAIRAAQLYGAAPLCVQLLLTAADLADADAPDDAPVVLAHALAVAAVEAIPAVLTHAERDAFASRAQVVLGARPEPERFSALERARREWRRDHGLSCVNTVLPI